MKLNSTSVILGRLRTVGVTILSIASVIGLVHVTARWLYATLGLFYNIRYDSDYEYYLSQNEQHRFGFNGWEYTRQPWYHLDFKWDWFKDYSSIFELCAVSHVLAIILLVIIGFLLWALWHLLFTPPHEEEGDDAADNICTDPNCPCHNHRFPRPDTYEDGEWKWTPSCRNPACPCVEHKNDEGGDTFARELNTSLS
jgi:hypothetical protein